MKETKAKPIHVISVVSSSSDEVSEDEVITISGDEETPNENGDHEPGTDELSHGELPQSRNKFNKMCII